MAEVMQDQQRKCQSNRRKCMSFKPPKHFPSFAGLSDGEIESLPTYIHTSSPFGVDYAPKLLKQVPKVQAEK